MLGMEYLEGVTAILGSSLQSEVHRHGCPSIALALQLRCLLVGRGGGAHHLQPAQCLHTHTN